MEPLLNNKKFVQGANLLMLALSVYVAMLFINEIKESKYIGRGNQPPATISVTGKGEVTAVSDIATLYVTLTKDGSTSKEAQNLLNEQVKKTLAYLQKQNIEEKDVKSEYGGITPKYASLNPVNCFAYPCPQPEPKIVGYTANQSITIKVRAVDTANDVRTGLASIDITNINGPTFSIDDEDILNDQARAKAIDDARAKAEVLAKELHVHLGNIMNFSENGGGYPMMYAKNAMMDSVASAAPAPELPKGENKITSTVTIIYEIR